MGFLFPLFLLAAVSLLIPVLLHLFNLRKFRRVYFPDTRFLRSLQMSTRKQSKIRNWWLMIMRMLFLAALVIAFAQPYFQSGKAATRQVIHALFIDNSHSMTATAGQKTLLDKCKDEALALVHHAPADARFVVLSHDRSATTRALSAQEAEAAIKSIGPSAGVLPLSSLLAKWEAIKDTEHNSSWAFYIFSDLQQPAFADTLSPTALNKEDRVYVYTARQAGLSNLSVDSCYFLHPVLDSRQPNPLVVHIKQWGKTTSNKTTRLQISIDRQVRAVKTIAMGEARSLTDTIDLQLAGNDWQQISVSIEDHPLNYDDTFRLAARVQPQLNVLVVGAQPLQAYLQAAFSPTNGFNLRYASIQATSEHSWSGQNLIVLQDVNDIPQKLQEQIRSALERGQQLLIFPGNSLSVEDFNKGMAAVAAIRLDEADTVRQTVIQLQRQHPLLNDLFESVPENVQLPTTLKRYPIHAGLETRQQTLMSYPDGTPFLAQYGVGQGKLYLCAAPLDDRYSNFAMSYFFMPVLYKMAIQSSAQQVYSRHIGDRHPLWLPVSGSDNRNVFHLSGPGFEGIPPQRPSGTGLDVYVGDIVQQPGFYTMQSALGKDTTWVGMNMPTQESILSYADQKALESLLQPARVTWLGEHFALQRNWQTGGSGFPLWKFCIGFALACLLVETWLLRRNRKQGIKERTHKKSAISY